MISEELIQTAKDFAYDQAKLFGTPALPHIELANEEGQKLADALGADKKIVLLGTLLMDCVLGQAIKQGKRAEHAEICAAKAGELLDRFKEVEQSEKDNVLVCIRQHHGAEKFETKEAEICCNADCYRFASIKGVLGGMRMGREMPIEELVSLYKGKVEEKWSALSLDACRKELEPQYRAIKVFFEQF